MGKITVGLFMAFDGVIEGPGPSDNFERAGWTMPYFSNEIGQIIGETAAASDALLLGRVTYDGFKSSFENQTDGMAMMLNNKPKYVASNTLKSADWSNTTLISGNTIEEIRKLKDAGKTFSMSGSGSLVHSLAQAGLVDEYALFVYPLAVGKGMKLFEDTGAVQTMKLLEARPLPSGVIYMHYQVEPKT
jgi:dihydrofolate reductase